LTVESILNWTRWKENWELKSEWFFKKRLIRFHDRWRKCRFPLKMFTNDNKAKIKERVDFVQKEWH
jgi:hypothetical protein